MLEPALERMTAEEVLASCQHGERDFRGKDLSGIKLRGADLRGADFRGATLKDASLVGSQLGPLTRWRLAQEAIGLLMGMALGVLNAFNVLLVSDIFMGRGMPMIAHIVGGLFLGGTMILMVLIVMRGLTASIVASAGVVAVLGAFARAADFLGTGARASGVAMAVAFAGTGAIAGAGIIAFIGAFAVSFVIASAGKLGPVPIVLTFAWTFGLLALSLYLRRRALAGDSRDGWLRSIALWLPGLGGARFAGADLTDADLSHVHIRGADLRRARLVRTTFRNALDLHLARFDGPLHAVPLQRLAVGIPAPGANLARQDLTALALEGADLRGANLRGAIMKEARLCRANLDGAHLEHADLCGADLRGASLKGTALQALRIDIHTFRHSGWTGDDLAGFQDAGVEILGLDGFPESVQVRLLGEKEGLTLYFSTRLSTFDKVLVDGVIVGVLGRDTRCHSEYRVHGDAAIVRLFDAPRADLERVAEALHQKVWEKAHAQETALVRMLAILHHTDLREGLSNLMGQRLMRMELHEHEADPSSPSRARLRWSWQNPTQPGADRLIGPRPCRLFLIYAAEDHELARQLISHLQPLVGQKLLDPYDPARLLPGDNVSDHLSAQLDTADAIVVLVSVALFQPGPWRDQMELAIARHKEGTCVIPVLLRAVEWNGTPLARLQHLPEGGRPVTLWQDRDAAWSCVVSGLRLGLLNQAQG